MGFLLVILKVQRCAHCSLSTELMCFWPVRDGNRNNIDNNRKTNNFFSSPARLLLGVSHNAQIRTSVMVQRGLTSPPQVSDDASVEVQGGANKAAGFLKNHKLWNSKIYFKYWVDQFASKRMSIYF